MDTGRDLAREAAEEDEHPGSVDLDDGRGVVLEARFGEAVRLGQGHPQLGAVQTSSWPAVENSEWAMPRPAVMRLTSPGRTRACAPVVSRCSISPENSQLTRSAARCAG